MAGNPFDQFDEPNPFDQFDDVEVPAKASPKPQGIGGYVADVITDVFNRAGGAALSGVAGVKDRRSAPAAPASPGPAAGTPANSSPAATPAPAAAPAGQQAPAVAPAQQASLPAQAVQQAEQQAVQQPDGTPESMDSATAATRLAELEVMDSTTGLNPVQQEERAALAQRLEDDAAREEALEEVGAPPQAVAAEPEADDLYQRAVAAVTVISCGGGRGGPGMKRARER